LCINKAKNGTKNKKTLILKQNFQKRVLFSAKTAPRLRINLLKKQKSRCFGQKQWDFSGG